MIGIPGCKHIAASREPVARLQPIQISASGIDAAELARREFTSRNRKTKGTASHRGNCYHRKPWAAPALAVHNNNLIALWQNSDVAETKMRAIGSAGSASSVAVNAESPTGAFANDTLFMVYIAKEKEKRSIWLSPAKKWVG